MKKFLISATALSGFLAFAGSALAADATIDPGYDWTGWYVGANLGYGFSDEPLSVSTAFGVPAGLLSVMDPDDLDGASGVFGGAQIGYNWQLDGLVLGAEADFQLSDINGDDTLTNGGQSLSASDDLDWFSTVRGRLGLPVRNGFLIYATGGLAFGKVDMSADLVNTPVTDQWSVSDSATKFGWTAGIGSEMVVTESVTVKAEYLYVNLANETITNGGTFFGNEFTDFRFKNDFHTIRLGVNWKF